jgi:ADP-heptose:LPS heptosyltransferase
VSTGNNRFFIFIGGGIGDVLMTTPMFRAIKQHFPGSFIAVSVMGMAQKITLQNNKHVDDIINLGAKEYAGLKGSIKLISYLKHKRFNYSFLNHIAERKIFFLSAFAAGIKNRIGYDRSSLTRERTYKYFVRTLTHRPPYVAGEKLRTQLNLDILKYIGINNSDLSYELSAINVTDKKFHKTTVGIHAGCDGRAELKRWDIDKFIELGKLIQKELAFEVKFYIGPAEADLIHLLKDEFTIVEGKPLEWVIADISNCNYFISNDSGLAHIAAAFKVPTIVLFGPTLKNEYILPTRFIAVENTELGCRPCFHLKKPCPINKLCLKSIDANDVFERFNDLVTDTNGSEAGRNIGSFNSERTAS